MPHFKSFNFHHNRPKFKLFLQKKYEIFESWGLPSDPRNSPHCRFLAPRLSLIMCCHCKFLSVFSLMPRWKSINFYQNKPKIKLYCKKKIKFFECWELCPQTPNGLRRNSQTLRTQSLSPLQISGRAPDTRSVLLILPSFRISRSEIIELAK